ncbi:MAG TPA: hypothetical protein VEU95_01625 [Micropepsaceae bacterium]|nr:hypothetical protein [Micropepsaceae bacterium]
MIPTFTAGFVGSIKRVLVEASKGIASSHHVHNVQAGIANVLSLLQHDDEINAAADRLSQTAADYLNRHGIASTTTIEQEKRADIDRFDAAQDSLAAFCASLERGRPNSRVRTLGLR